MNIRKPKYNQRGTIDCEVQHPDYGWIPFTASPDDVEGVGKDIYMKCMELEVEPYEVSVNNVASSARFDRDIRLKMLDDVISNPLRWADFSKVEKQVISQYRKDLLNVPQQEGFPLTINWPDTPEFI